MNPCLGEIRIFSGTYAPENWAMCDGSLLLISDNEQLYTLIGVSFGGDGRMNFGLPDLRGRVPVTMGQGPGLPNAVFATKSGVEEIDLTENNLPVHTHPISVVNTTVSSNDTIPDGNYLGSGSSASFFPANPVPTQVVNMSGLSVSIEGGSSNSQEIVQPSFVINYIICTNGIFPEFQ